MLWFIFYMPNDVAGRGGGGVVRKDMMEKSFSFIHNALHKHTYTHTVHKKQIHRQRIVYRVW